MTAPVDIKPFKFGPYEISDGVLAAPMCGISRYPFRKILYNLGVGLMFTEMAKCKALLVESYKTQIILHRGSEENRTVAQICDGTVEPFVGVLPRLEERGYGMVNINMGCPVPKVTKDGCGSAMMANVEKTKGILEAIVKASPIPVSIKIRTGFKKEETGVEIAKAAEEVGVVGLIVHGRRADQSYGKPVNMDYIAEIKNSVSIPVIGNGDIRTGEDAAHMIKETGVDGVMIGRAANGDPWLYPRIAHFLKTGEVLEKPGLQDVLHAIHEQFQASLALENPFQAAIQMRKFAMWYLKRFVDRARFSQMLYKIENEQDFMGVLENLPLRPHMEVA